MKIRRFLDQHIQGWLPREPNLKKIITVDKPKASDFQKTLGLKIVAALFWIFGFGGILTLFGYTSQTAFLPLNFQAFIIAVTATDTVLMFIVGAGLLTAKRQWINTAMVFSALSIVMFYLIPLRPAVPLELIVIFYLVSLRKDSIIKRATSKTPLLLIALLSMTLLIPAYSANAQLINPDKSLLVSKSQTGDKGDFAATLSIYQVADADKERDYYFLEVNLEGEQNLNYAEANISLSPAEDMFVTFTHLPKASPTGSFKIGLGVSSFSMGNAKTVFFHSANSSVEWDVTMMNPKQGETFSIEYIVPQNTDFAVSLHAEAKLADDIFGTLWMDKLSLEGVEISNSTRSRNYGN